MASNRTAIFGKTQIWVCTADKLRGNKRDDGSAIGVRIGALAGLVLFYQVFVATGEVGCGKDKVSRGKQSGNKVGWVHVTRMQIAEVTR